MQLKFVGATKIIMHRIKLIQDGVLKFSKTITKLLIVQS
uniref:Uncharacterized protein n=1 Tax=Arundo donax TaxID=35708 RepID=A0A0A9FJ14_ARUDO